jgi:putative peptidoglycan lipid II flippase
VGPVTPTRRGVVRAAALVAAITVIARVVGFGRWLVFSKTVGAGCLADAYATANQLPNVLFEIVVGGALAGAVIPVLAGPVARADRAAQGRIIGALLTWSALLLAPVAAAAWLLSRAYADTMMDSGCPGAAATAARMLAIFVPQVFGYAVAVVATAVLQSHGRFAAGALAPLASSVVVIATYVVFARQAPHSDAASRGAVDLLAWGTTLGVAALALTVLVPMLALRLPLRPVLRLDPGVGPVLRRLALAGLAVLVAQQLTFVVITYLANHRGTDGSVAVYTWAYAIFMLPFAVLAQPLTTAVFPRLAAAHDGGTGYDGLVAASARAVLLAGGLGAALLAGTAVPVARVFAYDDGQVHAATAASLADALLAFAPGLAGFAVLMHAGRALYARHAGRPVAVVTTLSWVLAAVVAVIVTAVLGADDAVAGLAAAVSIAMVAGGVAILWAVRRIAGAAALAGVARAAVAAALAATVAAVAGRLAAWPAADGGWGSAVLFAVLSGLAVAVCFGATVWWTGGDMTRQAVRSLSGGRLRRAGPRGTASGGSAAGGTEAM